MTLGINIFILEKLSDVLLESFKQNLILRGLERSENIRRGNISV